MEQKQLFHKKTFFYQKAITGFREALQIDLTQFDEIVADSIRNGQIQKFEYCTELTWKIIKKFLFVFSRIESNSPKEAIKNFFLTKQITQGDYESLLMMIDDRNSLNHIYEEGAFQNIHVKLKKYLKLQESILAHIEKNKEG